MNIVNLMQLQISVHFVFAFCPQKKNVYIFVCDILIMSTRVAKDEMGSDGHQVPDQTIQRLAASHPHRQHRHRLHRGE